MREDLRLYLIPSRSHLDCTRYIRFGLYCAISEECGKENTDLSCCSANVQLVALLHKCIINFGNNSKNEIDCKIADMDASVVVGYGFCSAV